MTSSAPARWSYRSPTSADRAHRYRQDTTRPDLARILDVPSPSSMPPLSLKPATSVKMWRTSSCAIAERRLGCAARPASIIYIDEIDKIGARTKIPPSPRRFGRRRPAGAAQDPRRHRGECATQGGRKHPHQSSRCRYHQHLFICGGAFVGLEKTIQRRTGTRTIGYAKRKRPAARRNAPPRQFWPPRCEHAGTGSAHGSD